MYVIAYGLLLELERQVRRLRAGLVDGEPAVGAAVGAGAAGDRLHERRRLLLGGRHEALGDDLAAGQGGDVLALGGEGVRGRFRANDRARDVALADALGA